MNAEAIKKLFLNLAERFEKEQERLADLDAILGDGDHGISMANGFAKANDAIKTSDVTDVGQLFYQAGRALMSAIGGASGPLFGMVLVELGKASMGSQEVTLEAFKSGVSKAADSVQRLGKAELGDKTMIDVLLPVNAKLLEINDLQAALEFAANTAREAAEETSKLAAKKGRAQYVQGAGLGHCDPGATSVAIVFEVLNQTYQEVTK